MTTPSETSWFAWRVLDPAGRHLGVLHPIPEAFDTFWGLYRLEREGLPSLRGHLRAHGWRPDDLGFAHLYTATPPPYAMVHLHALDDGEEQLSVRGLHPPREPWSWRWRRRLRELVARLDGGAVPVG